MDATLYQLKDEFLAVKAQLEDMELDAEAINDTLEALQMPIEQKTENILKLMKEWEALAEMKKAEAKRLQESASADLRKAERLKEYLQFNLAQAGIKKLQAGLFAVSFRKGSEVVEIDASLDLETLPPMLVKTKIEPNKTELKKVLKAGTEIKGVSLVRKPDSLQVK
jgi:hypothetical protein